jgi:adenosylmethionine-8-amino-7-oxononanoate aminotransferase
MVSGEGFYLYDINGAKYLDASSGLWNVSLGYSNEQIKARITTQLNELAFVSLFEHTNPTAVLAASEILRLLPRYMSKVFFTCSGSESVELAVKLARMYWGQFGKTEKKTILHMKQSYHGTYYASLGLSGLEASFISDIGPFVQRMSAIDLRTCSDCGYEVCSMQCLDGIEQYLEGYHSCIASVIIEPILASAGMKIVNTSVLNSLYEICNRHEILFMIDEIATGFYRTGKAFYFMNLGIQPDVLCMSKGINSGYLPFGAVAVNQRLISVFESSNDLLVHGSTQNGNLLACAASIATINQYKELNIEYNVTNKGLYIAENLRANLRFHRNVKEVRNEGLMIFIELCERYNIKCGVTSQAVYEVRRSLINKGLIVYGSESGILILPMLTITTLEADLIIDIITNVLSLTAL